MHATASKVKLNRPLQLDLAIFLNAFSFLESSHDGTLSKNRSCSPTHPYHIELLSLLHTEDLVIRAYDSTSHNRFFFQATQAIIPTFTHQIT